MSTENPNQSAPKSSQPSVGRLAVPVWIFIVALLLGYRGCVHVDQAGGAFAFSGAIYGPYRTAREVEDVQPKSGDAEEIAKGRAAYNANCSVCHAENGGGNAAQNFPPLAGSEWVTAEGPGRIIRIVLHGLQGPITVSGRQYNNQMVAIGAALSDEQVAQIVSYIRNAKAWGHGPTPIVNPAQVKAIRDSGRADQWKADELLKVPLN